jgi:hypothetical protein
MPDPLPGPSVSPDEQISRFLVSSKWFNPRTNHVSGQAFMPRKPKPPDTTYRTSVYRIDSCTSEEIWSIAEEYVSKRRLDARRVLARADVLVQAISAENLQIQPVPTPHPRHADIVEWPHRPEEHMEKANAMALASQLFLPPESSNPTHGS